LCSCGISEFLVVVATAGLARLRSGSIPFDCDLADSPFSWVNHRRAPERLRDKNFSLCDQAPANNRDSANTREIHDMRELREVRDDQPNDEKWRGTR
jgi:hypothetical protein